MSMKRAITLQALLEDSKEVEVPDAFILQNGKLLKVNMQASGGQVLTKAGAMIAYQGQMTFSRKSGGKVGQDGRVGRAVHPDGGHRRGRPVPR